MKYILAILSFLFHNFYLAQNSLEIKIINDTIKKVSYFDQNNVVYTITNTSEKEYLLIVDETGFNEDPEYKAELFYVGLPDYYIYENNTALNPMFSFGGKNSINSKEDTDSKEFQLFCKRFAKNFDEHEMRATYRISKKIITLKPKEEKTFVTQINFPYYRGRYFNLKNKSIYSFQISLQSPNEIISKYIKVLEAVEGKNNLIFTGQIYSNKIPLVYEVYNNQ